MLTNIEEGTLCLEPFLAGCPVYLTMERVYEKLSPLSQREKEIILSKYSKADLDWDHLYDLPAQYDKYKYKKLQDKSIHLFQRNLMKDLDTQEETVQEEVIPPEKYTSEKTTTHYSLP